MADLTLPAAMVEAAALAMYADVLAIEGVTYGVDPETRWARSDDYARQAWRNRAGRILTAALSGCDVRTEQQRLPLALQWGQGWHPTDEARFTRLVITTGWETTDG